MSMKTVHSPFLGRSVCFGRKRPTEKFKLKFSTYKNGALPTPPASVDYTAKAMASLNQLYLNDQLGDCVIAGGGHMRGVTSGNATGTPVLFTSAQIIAMYSAIGGYVPGNPATDNGCDENTAGSYWMNAGFPDGVKWLGFVGIDATNKTEVMQALDLFEGLMLGIELPDAWVNPMPSAPGFTWDVAGSPDPQNGHCVIAAGYNATGITISTWGMLGTMTWAALAEYASAQSNGQLFVAVSADMVAKGQTVAPNGVSWSALQADFIALGGQTITIPTPAPVPVPIPAPVPVPIPAPVPTPKPPHPQPPHPPRPQPPHPPHPPFPAPAPAPGPHPHQPPVTYSFTQAMALVNAGHKMKRASNSKELTAADIAATDWIME